MASTSGSCLCGTVKFQLTGDPQSCFVCHCTSCQKITGSAFSANCWYKQDQLDLIQGEESIKSHGDSETASGHTLTRSFCSTCGSNLFLRHSLMDASGMISVTSGTIDNRDNLSPSVEFFCRNKRGWLSPGGISGTEQKEAQ
ncbi:hypothetical protein FE257_004468 [Aspergillus nanangensis]|uniref:CENP-V/GFA domain-containing protein n=1 Tax=Aspergillus nanangensis TaxID=2582783 RepID=A0AAD4CYH1_ASPNN|nr:hypothetical protein FE257_004468 [Aspergillus nanangensis]